MEREELKVKLADLTKRVNELKDEIKVLAELKSPEELKAAAEYSVRGFRAVLFGEKAFRTDIAIFIVSSIVAFILPVSWCERALMVYSVFAGLLAEIVNTAIETVVDRVSLERHPLSAKAKDIASCLVVATFIAAGICWTTILTGLILKLCS